MAQLKDELPRHGRIHGRKGYIRMAQGIRKGGKLLTGLLLFIFLLLGVEDACVYADEADTRPGDTEMATRLTIHVSGADVDRLELGAFVGASDNADQGLDRLGPPAFPGLGCTRLVSPGDGRRLICDIRDDSAAVQYQLEIRAGGTAPITVRWDPTGLPALPDGHHWCLWRLTGLNGLAVPGTFTLMASDVSGLFVPADPEGDDAAVYYRLATQPPPAPALPPLPPPEAKLMALSLTGADVDRLEFGAAPDATDKADPNLDYLGPPAFPGLGSSRLISPGDGRRLIRDVRGDIAMAQFELEFRAGARAPISCRWNAAALPPLLTGRTWCLWRLTEPGGSAVPGTRLLMVSATSGILIPPDPEGDDAPVFFRIGAEALETTTVTSTETAETVTAPTYSQVHAGGPYRVTVFNSLTLAGSAGAADTAGTEAIVYAWDLDNDGQFDDATGATPVLSWATLRQLGLPCNTPNMVCLKVSGVNSVSVVTCTTLTLVNDADVNPTAWLLTLAVEAGSEASLTLGVSPDAEGDPLSLHDCAADETRADEPKTALYKTRDGTPLCTAVTVSRAETGLDGGALFYADWVLEVKTGSSAPCVLTWDPADVPTLGMQIMEMLPGVDGSRPDPDGRFVPGGTNINMGTTDSLTVAAGATKFFRLVYGYHEYRLTLERGWNLISLPLEPIAAGARQVMDNGHGGSVAIALYGYNMPRHGSGDPYVVADSLHALQGYWACVGEATTVTIKGARVKDTDYPLDVGNAYHLVGVAAARPLASAPGLFLPAYAYDPLLDLYLPHLPGDLLVPGKAYWFFVLTPTCLNPTDR